MVSLGNHFALDQASGALKDGRHILIRGVQLQVPHHQDGGEGEWPHVGGGDLVQGGRKGRDAEVVGSGTGCGLCVGENMALNQLLDTSHWRWGMGTKFF